MNSTKKDVIHKPVMLEEALSYLNIRSGGAYVDCTLGDGGYSLAILNFAQNVKLISLDVDSESINFVKEHYSEEIETHDWRIIKSNFAGLAEALEEAEVSEVDGIVFDLGLSSRQLETDMRGFSFRSDDPLDMRMDQDLNVSAEDLLNALSEKELEKIFSKFGEERYSRRIARSIKSWLKDKDYSEQITTQKLVELVRDAVPAGYREGSKNPATRVFQALRIAVNDELGSLRQGLSSALSVISPGGVIVVVSYHSLEDRIVKTLFRDVADNEDGEKFKELTPKPIEPKESEVSKNPRSRSAKLRAIKKIS